MVGTPGAVASHGPLIHMQHAGLPLPIEEIPPFGHLCYYRIFWLENNSIHYFYCQTERMFTWELLAALLDKGKDTSGTITSTEGSTIKNQMAKFTLLPTDAHITIQAWTPSCICNMAQTCASSRWKLHGLRLLTRPCTIAFQSGLL